MPNRISVRRCISRITEGWAVCEALTGLLEESVKKKQSDLEVEKGGDKYEEECEKKQ